VIGVLVVLALILLIGVARRRDTSDATGVLSGETLKRDRTGRKEADARQTGRDLERQTIQHRQSKDLVKAPAMTPETWVPPDPEALGVARRQFLNRSIIATFGLGLLAFGGAVLAFMWPGASTGFGSKIAVGKVGDVKSQIQGANGFLYNAGGRMWITEYPVNKIDNATAVYSDPELAGMQAGLVALFQKCPHLGCRVPECVTSQFFECPCHGSQYNRVGEKKGGPAPRGMDRFAMEVDAAGNFVVNTGAIIDGPPIGINTTGQEAEGPNCIGAADGH
jgi:cytochrome b6-f complex iron-sulfur subunit